MWVWLIYLAALATSKQEVMDLKRITEEREMMMIDHLQQVCLMNIIIVTLESLSMVLNITE